MTQLYLEINTPFGEVSEYPLHGSAVAIGRAVPHGIRIEASDISRHHSDLICDEFGRWRIVDRGSHNGTFVNGRAAPRHDSGERGMLVEIGDTISVGSFNLTLYSRDDADDSVVFVSGDAHDIATKMHVAPDDAPLATLRHTPRTMIDGAVLRELSAFGMRLHKITRFPKRLEALTGTAVSPVFKGGAAVCVRLSKESPTAPALALGPAAYARDWPKGQEIYMSRSIMRHVVINGEAVLGDPNAHGEGRDRAVEMTMAPVGDARVAMAAMACPLRSSDKVLDILYVVLDPLYATTDWLAVMSMLAKQWELVEYAWVMRLVGASAAANREALAAAVAAGHGEALRKMAAAQQHAPADDAAHPPRHASAATPGVAPAPGASEGPPPRLVMRPSGVVRPGETGYHMASSKTSTSLASHRTGQFESPDTTPTTTHMIMPDEHRTAVAERPKSSGGLFSRIFRRREKLGAP